MRIGYARVSKSDGSQDLEPQKTALIKAGVKSENIYSEFAHAKHHNRPELDSCLKSLRKGDTLVVWKLDRLGRSLINLVKIVEDLSEREIGLKVLTGKGAEIDTTTASGRMVFGIFAAFAEFEHEIMRERTMAGLAEARARGRKGGRKPKMSTSKIQIAQAAMQKKEMTVSSLCRELKISRNTLYKYVSPKGVLRADALKMIMKEA